MSSVYNTTSTGEGTSQFVSLDPIISFDTGPPSSVRHGQPFTIIVKVDFSGSGGMERHNFALNISLCDNRGLEYGKGLRGSLTSSLKTVMDGGHQQKAVFKDIAIHEIGRHRLRILLAAASPSKIKVRARHDSDFVEVRAA